MSKEKANSVPTTLPQKSESEVVQVKGEVVEVVSCEIPKKVRGSPIHSRSKWDQCKIAYERGHFTTVRELGERFGIKEFTLHSRINREGWKEAKEQIRAKAESALQKQVVKELTEQESYLKRSYLRSQRYEKLIDASLSQLATTPEGVPLCEPSDIDSLSRSEMRIAELSRIALRIPVLSQVDLTTGGKDLGTSFVQAIQKLRGNPEKLGNEDLSKVLEAEVE